MENVNYSRYVDMGRRVGHPGGGQAQGREAELLLACPLLFQSNLDTARICLPLSTVIDKDICSQ